VLFEYLSCLKKEREEKEQKRILKEYQKKTKEKVRGK